MGYAERTRTRTRRAALLPRLEAAGMALAVASAVGGCSSSEPETLTQIEDVQLDAIREVVPDADLEYKEVTVPGEVDEVISPASFAISDPGRPLVDPLLIVHRNDVAAADPGAMVNVTGIVYRGFDAAEVEKETGIDLDEALHQEWQGDSYIVASEVKAP